MKMKKIFLALMILIILCSSSFGAENDDIYVRKDLLEAYMKNIDIKFDQIFVRLDKIDNKLENLIQAVGELNARVTKVETSIDGVYAALSNRMEGVEKRFDVLFYLVIAFIGLIGVIFGLPVVQRWWEQNGEAKQKYLTAEDVEKIIEAKMKGILINA